MNPTDCGRVREAIPSHARRLELRDGSGTSESSGALSTVSKPGEGALEHHLDRCPECRGELELARALLRARAEPPPALAERIIARLRHPREAARHPAWALTAAAVAALALGIGLQSGDVPEWTAPAFAQEPAEEWPWSSDDGLVAGAPLFDELSDRDLTVLLDDLEVE